MIITVSVFLCCCLTYNRQPEHFYPSRCNSSPPVFTIPVIEEQQGYEEDIIRIYELYFEPSLTDPPVYSSGDVSPPPPYVVHIHALMPFYDDDDDIMHMHISLSAFLLKYIIGYCNRIAPSFIKCLLFYSLKHPPPTSTYHHRPTSTRHRCHRHLTSALHHHLNSTHGHLRLPPPINKYVYIRGHSN